MGLQSPVSIQRSFNIKTGIRVKMEKGIIMIFLHQDGRSLLYGNCLLPDGLNDSYLIKLNYALIYQLVSFLQILMTLLILY